VKKERASRVALVCSCCCCCLGFVEISTASGVGEEEVGAAHK